MKVRPLHDRLIIRTLEEQEKTKGGIIIPDTAKEKPVEGNVIAVGAGRIKKDGTDQRLSEYLICLKMVCIVPSAVLFF